MLIRPLSLNDVGNIVLVGDDYDRHYSNVEVVMVIQSPKRTMALYGLSEGYTPVDPTFISRLHDAQAKCIRAFMEFSE